MSFFTDNSSVISYVRCYKKNRCVRACVRMPTQYHMTRDCGVIPQNWFRPTKMAL